MKKRIAVIIAAGLSLCAIGRSADLEADFENGLAPFRRGWGSPSVDTSVSHSGAASLQIVGGGRAESPLLEIDAPVYKITGWMKTEEVVRGDRDYKKACVSINFLDADKQPVKHGRMAHKAFAYTEGTTDWTPFTYTLALDPEAGVRYIQVGLQNWNITTGTSWFDDVKVTAARGPEVRKGLMVRRGLRLPEEALAFAAEEAQTLSGATVTEQKDAYGTVTRLPAPGAAITLDLDLPPGDYTVRVRSLCSEADTFNEIGLSWNGEALRPHAVTNPFFTWQRSPFRHQGAPGGVLRIELAEGKDVAVDEVVVHPFAADHEIEVLRDFTEETVLAQDGVSTCVIVSGDDGLFSEEARFLAQRLGKVTGAQAPAVLSPAEVSAATFEQRHVIALGTVRTNLTMLATMPHAWHRVPEPPESGPQLVVAVEPYGTKHNLVALGGTTAAQIRQSMDAFLSRIEMDGPPAVPFVRIPANERAEPSGRDTYRERAIASGTWLRQGNIRHLYHQWKHASHDIFRLLSYRVMEYRDSPETIKRAAYDGAIDMEHYKVLSYFDRAEHYDTLSELERLDILNLLLAQARYCEGRFEVECGPSRRHHSDQVMEDYLAAREDNPRIAHNHQTFTTRSMLTAGRYFDRYYNLPDARKWIDWTDQFMMTGPLQTSKPQCDCYGYQRITMIHAARHASDTGRWDYFAGDPVNMFLRLRLLQYDNLGSGVGHGDVGGYTTPIGPDFRDEVVSLWSQQCADRYDFPLAQIEHILGLYVHPVEPLWYDFYRSENEVPLARTFDKITFRNAVDPEQAYLILDGLSRGYHGHWDGNSILRFTDNGRMWLCEGSYIKTDPKEHNTLTIMRNGISARPGKFSALRHRVLSPHWGITVTRTPDYADVDWDRVLVWHRPTGTFLVADSARAQSEGTYDVAAYFRSLGISALDGRTWRVEQKGGEAFTMHFPGDGALSTSTAPDDAGSWAKYTHSDDPVPKIVRHRTLAELQAGESATLFTTFYADKADAPSRLNARALGQNAMAVRGDPDALLGLGSYDDHGFDVRGEVFVLTAEGPSLLGGARLIAREHGFQTDQPVTLSFEADMTAATIQAATPTRIDLSGAARIASAEPLDAAAEAQIHDTQSVTVPAGITRLELDRTEALRSAFAQATEEALATAEATPVTERPAPAPTSGLRQRFSVSLPDRILCLAAGQVDGQGGDEAVAGCADGTVAVVDENGIELWRRKLSAKINDIAVADLDGDGRAEILCGIEDSRLVVLNPDGSERFTRFFEAYRSSGGIEGHVRCVLVDDIDNDGAPNIAVGCANTFYYVMDAEGNTLSTNDMPWKYGFRHKGLSIEAADLTGDGVKELLFSHTYNNRFMVDFTDTSNARAQSIGGTKAGCRAITAVDVDGDDLPEAIFGDMDGQLTAAERRTDSGRGPGVILWQHMVGTDEISALHGGDFTGDGAEEILLASHSGFLALLDATGEVRWIRYADNQVTDAEVAAGERVRFVRSSADGSVAIYTPSGDETARWHIGTPVQCLALPGQATGLRVFAAAENTLLGADLDPQTND